METMYRYAKNLGGFCRRITHVQMKGKSYMLKALLLAAALTVTTAVAQDAQQPRPERRGPPPQVQCEEMKKLMKAVQDHRATCEVCKTNLPPRRGPFGPAQGRGPGGRGPGPHQGPPPAPAPEK